MAQKHLSDIERDEVMASAISADTTPDKEEAQEEKPAGCAFE